jgi:hypothetical protein
MAASTVANGPTDGNRNVRASDPFVASGNAPAPHLRYSNFDSTLFALGPGASAEQAKRALEAHLAETERRMEEAGKLGTTLVQQRQELADRLKEVEALQAEEGLTPELRQKLVEVEKDYNEVARESARAFLPKTRVPSNELAAGSPFAPEGKGGRVSHGTPICSVCRTMSLTGVVAKQRSVSPSKFESQAIGSPTKFAVPNRKLRNQANRNHDIEFAAEISTSLIAQVRNLQALLAEREEELRDVKVDKSKLEMEAEGFQQRVKTLDESEHRYKDENWNLETQIHELIAKEKEAADREKKLGQALSLLQAEKANTQRELDEVKMSHSKLAEEHAAAMKHHDIEFGTAKRNIATGDNERAAMQKKIDDLTGQNQELAQAFALQRGRAMEREAAQGLSDDDFETANDNATPEHSPPPSPVKGTPRHSMLESETLKTSLTHAQRTIQSLRTNVHREKTEKLELKRMLAEARDELERMRGDPSAASRRSRKVNSTEFKKSGRLGALGSARTSKNEILLDDEEWEDNLELGSSPPQSAGHIAPIPEGSDHFDTAHETSDAAFETAHERGTETEDFQTGLEDMSDEDNATETESPSRGVGKARRPGALTLTNPASRFSFQSTASTSNDDEDYTLGASDLKTPTAASSNAPQKMRLRVSRGGLARRSRMSSEDPSVLGSSPASFVNSSFSGTPQQPGQSLAAELGDFDGSEEESVAASTPGRASIRSPKTAESPPPVPPLPRAIMVDNGTMTDFANSPVPHSPQSVIAFGRPMSMGSVLGPEHARVSQEWPEGEDDLHSRPDSAAWHSDTSAGLSHDQEHMDDKLSQFPSPPSSPPKSTFAPIPILLPTSGLTSSMTQMQVSEPSAEHEREVAQAAPLALSYSSTAAQEVLPIAPSPVRPTMPPLSLSSSTLSQNTEPVITTEPVAKAAHLSISSVYSVDFEPVEPRSPKRNAFIIPHDNEETAAPEETRPVTPPVKRGIGSLLGWGRGKSPATPVIAEDETRQSPSDVKESDTPESQRPLKELSSNSSARPLKKQAAPMADQGMQTSLTSETINGLLAAQAAAAIAAGGVAAATVAHGRTQSSGSIGTPSTVRHRRSQESIGSVVRSPTQGKMVEAAQEFAPTLVAAGSTPGKRPGSATSARASMDMPPLPANHKEVIEAARTGSAAGGQGTIGAIGTMGPPPLPASALRGPGGRPRTPQAPKPSSPVSVRGTPTPRAIRTSNMTGEPYGTATQVYTPSRATGRSRQSSVSSFASEIDTRFNNMTPGMMGMAGMGPAGFGPNTDPRMIQAITQTMIGEYLWKYTRKAGRGDMSSTRHRRYFWVHPYTRTMYWSERDPTNAGRAELRAKSVPIEAVRVVTDDNPMPPGLHRKSLVIISPGRTVKVTCTTGQRHETWFNALSYLLLRTGQEGAADAEELAGQHITQEDVDEFNPQIGRRMTGGSTAPPRPPPSLSGHSVNSRTGRADSPAVGSMSAMSMRYDPPTLTPTPHANAKRVSQAQQQQRSSSTRPSMGTFSRLSGFMDSFRSRSRSVSRTGFNADGTGRRASRRGSVYGVAGEDQRQHMMDEAHDSAEDLRLMIEQQDREADRLENVRACCDGQSSPQSINPYM